MRKLWTGKLVITAQHYRSTPHACTRCRRTAEVYMSGLGPKALGLAARRRTA